MPEKQENDDEASDGGLRTTGLFGLDGCPLHRKTPYGMTNVSMTQLSIARHYGGIKYNGESYTYLPKTDELIRNDVLKWQTKNAKKSLPNAKCVGTDASEKEAMKTEPTPTLAAVDQPRLVRRFRRLEMGEIVLATDEIYDDHKREWVEPEWSEGKPAPDPAYTSHRQFRREIIYMPNAEVRHGAKDADLD